MSDAASADELAYRLRQQELIAEFALFALRANGLDQVLDRATRIAAEGMAVEFCKCLEYRPGSNDLLVRAGIGWAPGTVGIATLAADLESPAGFAFQTGQPVLSNHLDREQRFRTPRLLAEHGVRRALNVPINDGARPYGVLEVDSSESGHFTTADFAFMQSVANTLSVAIEQANKDTQLEAALERETILVGEMRHRVRNLFAIVTALVNASRRDATTVDDFATGMTGRIRALAAATDAGLGENPAADAQFDPAAMTRRVLEPYGTAIAIDGDPGPLPGKYATPLALTLHELATNAVKYGALSDPAGQIAVRWHVADGKVRLSWHERNGPAVDAPPASTGFGERMITRILASVAARLEQHWNPAGLTAELHL